MGVYFMSPNEQFIRIFLLLGIPFLLSESQTKRIIYTSKMSMHLHVDDTGHVAIELLASDHHSLCLSLH